MSAAPIDQPTRPLRIDWLVVAGLLVFSVAPYALSGRFALALVLILQVVPLAWRRARPAVAFLAVALATVAQVPVFDQPAVPNVSLMIALASLITWTTGFRWYAVGLGVCAVGVVVASVDWALGMTGGDVSFSASNTATYAVGCLICIAAAVAFGEAGRRRRQLMLELHARALDAERERDQHARLAAQTERTRIARDMHDVVAHALAVIVVQSDGAAYAARHASSPDAAAQALDVIGQTSRSALAETRRLVGVLREEGEALDLSPSTSVGDIPELVERVRTAGLEVHLAYHDVKDIPPGPGAAAYRVVQESLTNIIKHAGPATARVEVARDEHTLSVLVADSGRGLLPGANARGGYGLLGMSERVSVLGGTLAAGNQPAGGFIVSATIPLRATDPTIKDQDRLQP
ncbi:sensor histidine kinase [Demetria terragena]|uniref:sensor histidine kinase n=1 Tax=Demetria terragena TaxID=63959 RepID=UPI0003720D5A|nr:sensor histidine kinase [Demetria terragena]